MKKLLLVLILSATFFASSLTPLSFRINNQSVAVVTPTYADHCGLVDPACGLMHEVLGIFQDVGGALGELVKNVIKFIMNTFVEILGGNAQARLIGPPQNLDQAYEQYGALGAIGLTVQDMYQKPPLSSKDYLASINPIVPVFAQSGETVLNPVLDFWKVTRNVAYIFFVLIIVTIGFMIMFRSKIDPRTTVSVTAAIPNLIISLVLITFSFAMAGFIIDMGRVAMDLVRSILISGSVSGGAPVAFEAGVNLSTGDIWRSFISLQNPVNFGGGLGGGIIGIFVTLVVLIFAFIVAIQVFLMLLFRYINLIVKPIFAPFTFLFGALPGKGGNIVSWFKSYLVDALTFPITLIILNLALVIKNDTAIVSSDPFGFLAGGANLNTLVSLGVLLLATKVPAILEDALDVKHSANVERAGAQPASMAKQIPIIKNFL